MHGDDKSDYAINMDSIFAKIILFFASILTVISGPSYIKLGVDSLTFDFKTGEIYPIYYFLNVQNVGPKKERFEIYSDQSWVSARREGTDFNFVELPSRAYVNFVLEIRPERLADGVNKAKVNLRVLDIESLASQEVVLDEAEVPITLNKNIVLTQTVEPSLSPIITPFSTQILSPTPTSTLTSQPAQAPKTTADLNPILKQIQSIIDSLRLLLMKLF